MSLIEIFRSDCDECERAVEMVKKNKPAECKCNFRIYDLSTLCESGDCGCGCGGILTRIKEYDIKTIPSFVMDGDIILEGKLSDAKVKEFYQNVKCG